MAKNKNNLKFNSKLILLTILLLASFFRLWRLNEVPVSLFGDELDVGYHAYSILKTGKDYSGNAWPLHFHSLAEWRTPLYLYSVVPTVALFGISPLGVRLPAAIFGIIGILGLYLLVKELFKNEKLALISALVLTLSPWHIQYSRAAFEVTELLAFFLIGLYLFFKSFKDGKWLWLSASLLVTTPLIYSTAKLFTPPLLLFLIVVWRKEIFKISQKHLLKAGIFLLLFGGITAYATLYSGGGQRFGYIGVFTDPTVASEIDYARLQDARFRGEVGEGISPKAIDRYFHNKGTYWLDTIIKNYLTSFSTNFLFIKGDPNPRHSIEGVGQFYYIEAIALLLGIIFLYTRVKDKRLKYFLTFCILFGAFPSAITRDGGNHATRLIIQLPIYVIFISYGIYEAINSMKGKTRFLFTFSYIALFLFEFIFYQHYYWSHNPWHSERWWHSGFEEAIKSVKEIEGDYDRVIISMAEEPAWIFFAGWYEYPPEKWHKGFPMENKVLEGFGEISYIDKFYFGAPKEEDGGFYALPKYIDENTVYLAVAKEVGTNLIKEPNRVPPGLKLIKPIAYPSGEPAFYIFTKSQ